VPTVVLNKLGGCGVFGDEVFTSTDLNRRSGEVLNRARLGPVTISRNNEQFALLRRDQAASLVRTVSGVGEMVVLLSEAKSLLSGGEPLAAFSWLKVFEKDDLEKLCSEVLCAARNALSGESDFDEVDAVIHEWHESALVAQSGVIDQAIFQESTEEADLPHPATLTDKC
jgi:prevent-host-death family protein